jgi:hypothetical protein
MGMGESVQISTSAYAALVDGGNGSGAVMPLINDQILSGSHVPDALQPYASDVLEDIENELGITDQTIEKCVEQQAQ